MEVELSRARSIRLSILDSQMRLIKLVPDVEPLATGIHNYEADLEAKPAGIYFMQLVADGQTITEKVVKQ